VHIKDLRSQVDKMPFNKLLGIHVQRLHSDGLTIECKLRPDLMNLAGVLHGGVLATLADAAVGIALQRHFGGVRAITTVELKINYLRPVSAGKVRARARLLKVGARIAVGSVDLKDDAGKIVAAALLSYMLL
jgi:acyl-CoA thioesterase